MSDKIRSAKIGVSCPQKDAELRNMISKRKYVKMKKIYIKIFNKEPNISRFKILTKLPEKSVGYRGWVRCQSEAVKLEAKDIS